MSIPSIPLSRLESSPAFSFPNLGDKVAGRIVDMEERNQTDPHTGAVKTFQDGTARTMWVITLQRPDGERVAIYATGGKYTPVTGQGESMLSAIGTAVRKVGAEGVDVNGDLAVAHTGLGEAKPGMNAPKLYVAEYRPPTPSIPASDLFGS